jgi:hypothetical protein
MQISTAARRLARQHNSDKVISGGIYSVNLDTGEIDGWVASFSAAQPSMEWRRANRRALLRISYGRMTQQQAQQFIDELGEGW